MSGSEKKVLLTGATGLVGRALSKKLFDEGFSLVVTGRGSEEEFRKKFPYPSQYYVWSDPSHTPPPKEALAVDSIIHLMGEPIAGKRWNASVKKSLFESRVLSTRNLVSALEKYTPGFSVFISASAIGIYGDRGDEVLKEDSRPGEGFLADLVQKWEEEVSKAKARSIQVRTGIVLSREGGALAKMEPLFRNHLGGVLGSGKQWMSWIHIDDLVEVFFKALTDPSLSGPVNAVSPNPVSNREFTENLARALKVKAFLRTPKFFLRLGLGEMGSALIEEQRVFPEKAIERGFQFKYPSLRLALQSIYSI